MSTNKPFMKLNELVAALVEAERGMGAGTLGLDGLEKACDHTRELHERFIVLRHKAREAAVGQGGGAKANSTGNTPEAGTEVKEPVPVRLDTRPMETTPRQTSLIEAIESNEQEEVADPVPAKPAPAKRSANESGARSKPAPSVAEKLEKAAVPDLGKAISLSHKFWFVAELFNGDRINYEKSIEKLNAFGSHAEAERFVQQEVIEKLKKPADPEAVATFTDLVQRRFS